jgi:hypothetical protein
MVQNDLISIVEAHRGQTIQPKGTDMFNRMYSVVFDAWLLRYRMIGA